MIIENVSYLRIKCISVEFESVALRVLDITTFRKIFLFIMSEEKEEPKSRDSVTFAVDETSDAPGNKKLASKKRSSRRRSSLRASLIRLKSLAFRRYVLGVLVTLRERPFESFILVLKLNRTNFTNLRYCFDHVT